MQEELIKVFDYTDQNDEIKSVVISGEGRAYCAGRFGELHTFNYAEKATNFQQ